MRGFWLFQGCLVATILLAGLHLSLDAQSTVLVQAGDLHYEGAFRLPQGNSGGSKFDSGGTALGYYAGHDSLFAVGHPGDQQVAEITIPTPSKASTVGGLPFATFLQPFADPLEGRRGLVGGEGSETDIGGVLPSDAGLTLTAFIYYDANGEQVLSHFHSGLTLSQTGDVQGPYPLSAPRAGWVSGYLGWLPTEWQSAFGGPALAGQCCIPITSRTSSGPTVSVFDPVDVGTRSPIPSTLLLGYPLTNPLPVPYFNLATEIRGFAVPSGARSILFVGKHGTGPICYGTAQECGDPTSDYKGYHAYPYVHQMWAYDLNDLLKVKNGQKQSWAIVPYATWTLDLPFSDPGHSIRGVTFDPGTSRLFISAGSLAEYNSRPIIHVFTVTPGTLPVPAHAPTNVRVVRNQKTVPYLVPFV
jgi:hypothetical protein